MAESGDYTRAQVTEQAVGEALTELSGVVRTLKQTYGDGAFVSGSEAVGAIQQAVIGAAIQQASAPESLTQIRSTVREIAAVCVIAMASLPETND